MEAAFTWTLNEADVGGVAAIKLRPTSAFLVGKNQRRFAGFAQKLLLKNPRPAFRGSSVRCAEEDRIVFFRLGPGPIVFFFDSGPARLCFSGSGPALWPPHGENMNACLPCFADSDGAPAGPFCLSLSPSLFSLFPRSLVPRSLSTSSLSSLTPSLDPSLRRSCFVLSSSCEYL